MIELYQSKTPKLSSFWFVFTLGLANFTYQIMHVNPNWLVFLERTFLQGIAILLYTHINKN